MSKYTEAELKGACNAYGNYIKDECKKDVHWDVNWDRKYKNRLRPVVGQSQRTAQK